MNPQIPVFRPKLLSEPRTLLKTLGSSWWGTGQQVERFETEFAEYLGVEPDRCIMLNSCTAALHLAVKLLNKSRRVLLPSLTFVSTGLAALHEGLEPVFVDVREDDLCMDAEDALRKLRFEEDVLIGVHLGGQAADLLGLERCLLIEDCAHALGTFEDGTHVGTRGIGCFSFQATKILPIGDGGMLVLQDKAVREEALALAWCGISKSTWDRTSEGYAWQYQVQQEGYKYRANDLTAALALDQWKGFETALAEKRRIAEVYSTTLADLDWLQLPKARLGTEPSWQEYTVKTPLRDRLMRHLGERGISTTVHYEPIHHYPIFRDYKTEVPVTERVWTQLVTLPSYVGLLHGGIERVVDGIRSFRP